MELEHSFTVPAGIEDAWRTLLDVESVAPCMPGATLETIDGDHFTGKVKVKLGPISLTYGGSATFLEKDDATHHAVIEASGKETRGTGTAKATVRAQLTSQGDTSTRVDVVTDLNITGKPAQFGRGVMVDVGGKLIGQFADCLAGKMSDAGAVTAAGLVADAADAPGPVAADAGDAHADAAVAGAPAPAGSSDAEGAATASMSTGSVGATAADPAAGAAGTSTAPPDRPSLRSVPSAGPRPTPDAIDLLDAAGAPVLKRAAPVIGGLLLLLLVWRLLRRRSA